MIRRRCSFSGRVQGVGFRAATVDIARAFPVTGWVRNEPDGTVTMECQAEADELLAFLAAHRQRLAAYIDEHAELDLPPLDSEVSFTIHTRR